MSCKLEYNNRSYTEDEMQVVYNYNLNKKLKSGFLKDYNFTVEEHQDLREILGSSSKQMIDLASKVLLYKTGEKIDASVGYLAYRMLAKQNSKVRSELKQFIHNWKGYNESYRKHSQAVSLNKLTTNKLERKQLIKERVIIDFLGQHIDRYNRDPAAFDKIEDKRWTSEDFTLVKKFLRKLADFLYKLGIRVSKEKSRKKINNIGIAIAHEIITQEYDIFKYELSEEQVQKYYDSTLNTDPFARGVVDKAEELGLNLVGSLALRKQGDLYRTEEETLHDLDFVVPQSVFRKEGTLQKAREFAEKNKKKDNFGDLFFSGFVSSSNWFKELTKKYPSYHRLVTFVSKEDLKESKLRKITTIGVIDGEFYKKPGIHKEERKGKLVNVVHEAGEYKKGTGYLIDFFAEIQDDSRQGLDKSNDWIATFVAKLEFGRPKDIIDYKYFKPFKKVSGKDKFFYDKWAFESFDVIEGVPDSNWFDTISEDTAQVLDYVTSKSIAENLDSLFGLTPEAKMEINNCN